nr:hypothetical protein CFP56_19856 [Quercus suber]
MEEAEDSFLVDPSIPKQVPNEEAKDFSLNYPQEEKEIAEGEDTASEAGNTNEDIDNFTLDPKDMEASPTQPQQQP